MPAPIPKRYLNIKDNKTLSNIYELLKQLYLNESEFTSIKQNDSLCIKVLGFFN